MPTLTIDNQSVTVPEGTNVLEAAKALGIVVPHFCYHEALGAVGACRLCAVKFLDGPVKGVQMACMVEAKDGMVVATGNAEASELRSHVIEWLMMNHPHDCPVCDEGGECRLQEMTIAGGHSIRRYRGPKRTYLNQDLGPFVEQEMNRCIQCYRCVRTYRDYCGGEDFGVMGSRDRLFFGRFRDGRLQSPFSGNLIDVCPTGVFTDKTFRFRSRQWDLEQAPSVCPHCSLGCALVPAARYRELQRVKAGVNRQVNGFFICDRGRFGYGAANHPDRPRTPRVEGRESTWPEALAAVRARLDRIRKVHGPGSIAFVGSGRASLEANFLLGEFARRFESQSLVLEAHPHRDRAARVAARLCGLSPSLEEVRRSDCILLLGLDPKAEAPLLALALRQAWRNGATLMALDPRPLDLPCPVQTLSCSPERLALVLGALEDGVIGHLPSEEAAFAALALACLEQAKRPVILGGADLLGEAGALGLGRLLMRLGPGARGSLVLCGPNSLGAALLAPAAGATLNGLLEGMRDGHIRALVCLESDPLSEHPDQGWVGDSLSRLEALIVLDCLPTGAAGRAHYFLPSTHPAETAGVYVSQEGRMQAFSSVFSPGEPLRVTGQGGHPPRTFGHLTPGSLPRPAWAVLAALAGEKLSLRLLRRRMEQIHPMFSGLAALKAGGEGLRLSLDPPAEVPERAPWYPHPSDGLRLLAVESLFGSDPLGAFSSALAPVVQAPYVLAHPEDALHRNLSDGETIWLVSEQGMARVRLECNPAVARGLVVAPRLRGTELDFLVPGAGLVPVRLEREAAR